MELLGRYIANNTHLDTIHLMNCSVADNDMPILFQSLTKSSSIKELNLFNYDDHTHDAYLHQVALVGILHILSSSTYLAILV